MKGILYSLKIKKSSNEYIIFENLNMKDICSKVISQLDHLYGINVKCNNQTIYNLQFRHSNVNRLLRSFIVIEQMTDKKLLL